jgi:hypothetical protein
MSATRAEISQNKKKLEKLYNDVEKNFKTLKRLYVENKIYLAVVRNVDNLNKKIKEDMKKIKRGITKTNLDKLSKNISRNITLLSNKFKSIKKLSQDEPKGKFKNFSQIDKKLKITRGKKKVVSPVKSYKTIFNEMKGKYQDLPHKKLQQISSFYYRSKYNQKIPDSIIIEFNKKIERVKKGAKTKFNIKEFRKYRTPSEFVKYLMNKLKDGKIYHLEIDYLHYTIGENLYKESGDLFLKHVEVTRHVDVSDTEYYDAYDRIDEVSVYRYDPKKKTKKRIKNGGFFPYYNNTSLDLSKYQIYKNSEEMLLNRDNDCLIKALEESEKLEENQINNIKKMVNNSVFPVCKLALLAEKCGIKICLTSLCTSKKLDNGEVKEVERQSYHGKGDIEIKIGLLANHYFINDKIDAQLFAIKNYSELKDVEDWNKIYRKNSKGYPLKTDDDTSAFKVIRAMLNNKDTLSNINYDLSLMSTFDYNKKVNFKDDKPEDLEYNEDTETKAYVEDEEEEKQNKPKKPKIYKKVFFDFETETDGNHVPYGVAWKREDGEIESAVGERCAKKMLKSIAKKDDNEKTEYVLYAHFATYDYNFIANHLYLQKELKRGSRLIYAKGTFYDFKLERCITIHINDTYNIIEKPLRAFPAMFGLEGEKKEILPYDLYNTKEVNFYQPLSPSIVRPYLNKQIEKDEPIYDHLPEREKRNAKIRRSELLKQFNENINKWGCFVDGKLDMLKYSMMYCKQDVNLLCMGFEKFSDWMWDITGLDISKFKTLPSFANNFIESRGCFDGCYKLAGIPQQFIQKCIVGGRCMSANNEKYHIKNDDMDKQDYKTYIVEGKGETKFLVKKDKDILDKAINRYIVNGHIQDFDAVSLYPSAMARLPGLLKGRPKVIKPVNGTINYDSIKNYDGYYLKIKILEVPIKRDFPLLSYKREDDIREWTNKLEGKIIYLDKTTLEDAIQYQSIKFEIISGYYFDEGFNHGIVNTIKFLFNERLKKKSEGNPIQELYKLLMNSAYGKLIMRPIKDEIVFKSEDDFDVFYQRNNNSIKMWYKTDDMPQYKIERVKAINDHFNGAHLGSQVLSMSKRIMSEVMCTAEDMGIKIFYQDTDSMHILENSLSGLSDRYKEIFKRELIGKNMGQFHSDFASKYLKDIYSSELIILGKKSYVDKLEGVVKDSKNNEKDIDYHIRLKGVPQLTINYKLNKDKSNPIELYKKLLDGARIHFDLLNDKTKKRFEVTKTYLVKTKEKFPRELRF